MLHLIKIAFILFLPIISYSKQISEIMLSPNNMTGTAFVLEHKSKKYVITAGHGCEGHKEMVIKKNKYRVLISRWDIIDLCVLEYNNRLNYLKAFKIDFKTLMTDKIQFEGYHQVKGKYVKQKSEGVIKNIHESQLVNTPNKCEEGVKCVTFLHYPILIESDMKVYSGNSGSPVFTKNGVIGIIAMRTDTESFFTPIYHIIDFIEGRDPFPINKKQEELAIEKFRGEFCNGFKTSHLMPIRFRSFNLFCVP